MPIFDNSHLFQCNQTFPYDLIEKRQQFVEIFFRIDQFNNDRQIFGKA